MWLENPRNLARYPSGIRAIGPHGSLQTPGITAGEAFASFATRAIVFCLANGETPRFWAHWICYWMLLDMDMKWSCVKFSFPKLCQVLFPEFMLLIIFIVKTAITWGVSPFWDPKSNGFVLDWWVANLPGSVKLKWGWNPYHIQPGWHPVTKQ